MEFKGTKGNWVLNKHIIESDLGCDIAEVWDYNDEENQANALLISKAPEMLEMLNKALIIINDLDSANSDMMNELYHTKVYKNFTKHSSFCDKLEQLIKKATEL